MIQIKSRKPLVLTYGEYVVRIDYGVGDADGFLVTITRDDRTVAKKYVTSLNAVVKLLAEKIDAKIADFANAQLNSIIMREESGEDYFEAETEHMIWPLGLSSTYYFYTAAGWRKAYVREEDGEPFFDGAYIRARFAPHVANFLHHLPPGDAMDFSVLYETDRILEELAAIFSAYISARREYIQLAAVWSLLTYARHAFKFAEYLRIHKSGFGSGGSTAAKVVSYFSARPLRPLVATTAAAFMRIVHVAKPTVIVDEIREEELSVDMLNMLKLYVETAYDSEYLVARVLEGEVKDFSLYSNVIVVDTSYKFTTLSAERRAWTFRIERDASRSTDLDVALEDAKRLAPRLYAWGMAFSLKAASYIKKYRNVQGTGAVDALVEFMSIAGLDTSVASAVRDLVRQQLSEAFELATVTDPVARILSAVDEVIEEAVDIYRATGVAPEKWHIDSDSGCLYIYLDTLRRIVASKFRRLHEITVHVEVDANQRTVETSRQSQWYRVERDVEPYLDMRKFAAIVRQRYKLAHKGRNHVVMVCQ